MISLKRKEQGFTIVELLIVIIVIGILAFLVFNTYSGIQKKARNTERVTDIAAIYGQLEAYYAQSNKYPTLAELNDSAWRTANMKGLDSSALQDPRGPAQALVTTVGANNYAYVVTPSGCDNTTEDCVTYVLTATREDDTAVVKNNLN